MATKPISPGQSYEYRFHGTDTRGLYDTAEGPAWNSHAGRFGRMFHSVPVFVKDPEALRELADGMQDEGERDNPEIPAGFTYLGQFVDHDITFDTASSLQRANDPEALENFRTPRYDLDSLYGCGPADDPFLYDQGSEGGIKLLVGKMQEDDGTEVEEDDLPRNRQGRALIGDPRNDENTFIAQLQLTLIKFSQSGRRPRTGPRGLVGPRGDLQGSAADRPLALPVGGRPRLPWPDRSSARP